MKKLRLEDIEKQRLFADPPEGYFDKLPGIIQSRTANKPSGKAQGHWVGILKLMPAAALVVLIAFYSGLLNQQDAVPGFDALLSEVTTYDMMLYLEELDLSNEEIMEEVDFRSLSLEFDDMQDPLIDNLDIEDETLIQLYDEFDIQDSLL